MLKELSEDQILGLAFIGSHISGIAHNINTPLTAIFGRMELLQMRLKKISAAAGNGLEAELEKCFNDLATIGKCCTMIDDGLKNCVMASSGIIRSQPVQVQLDELLKSVLAFLNADMEFKHQMVKVFQFRENIPPVTGDLVAYSAAFLEILYNARSAMLHAAQKRLTVEMSAADGQVRICFSDTGCGISEAIRQELLRLLGSAEPACPAAATLRESGLQRVGRLLKPYGVTYDIRSRPGETCFALTVPVEK